MISRRLIESNYAARIFPLSGPASVTMSSVESHFILREITHRCGRRMTESQNRDFDTALCSWEEDKDDEEKLAGGPPTWIATGQGSGHSERPCQGNLEICLQIRSPCLTQSSSEHQPNPISVFRTNKRKLHWDGHLRNPYVRNIKVTWAESERRNFCCMPNGIFFVPPPPPRCFEGKLLLFLF